MKSTIFRRELYPDCQEQLDRTIWLTSKAPFLCLPGPGSLKSLPSCYYVEPWSVSLSICEEKNDFIIIIGAAKNCGITNKSKVMYRNKS